MKITKLGDLVKISIGRTPSRSDPAFWDKERTSGNAWLSIADLLNTQGRTVEDSKEYITDTAAQLFPVVPKGTLLVSFKLTLGRLAFAGKDLRTNEAIAALHSNETEICNEYLYYFLSHFDWMDYASKDKKVKGFTLNKAKLNEIIIRYPESIEEQRQIVERLDAAFEKIDRAIELTKKNIILAESIIISELSTIFLEGNDSWDKGRLDKFCILQRGHDLPKSARTQGEYNIAASSGVIDTHDEYKAKGPGVYTGRSGSIGRVFYEPNNFWPLNTVLYVKEFYDNAPKLIYYLIKSLDFKKYAGGTGVPTLNRNDVHSIIISFPPPEQQQALIKKLDDMSNTSLQLAEHYNKKLQCLIALKQSILTQAFSESDVK